MKQLHSFFGIINYYHHFISNLCFHTKSLTTNLKKGHSNIVQWTTDIIHDFDTTITLFCNSVSLIVPSASDVFSVVTDASAKGIGGVLGRKYRSGSTHVRHNLVRRSLLPQNCWTCN